MDPRGLIIDSNSTERELSRVESKDNWTRIRPNCYKYGRRPVCERERGDGGVVGLGGGRGGRGWAERRRRRGGGAASGDVHRGAAKVRGGARREGGSAEAVDPGSAAENPACSHLAASS